MYEVSEDEVSGGSGSPKPPGGEDGQFFFLKKIFFCFEVVRRTPHRRNTSAEKGRG